MRYKLAIFDLDGTLLDSLEDLANSMNYALRENGLPERTLEEIRSFVGNGIRCLTERSVPGGTAAEMTDVVFSTFRRHYAEHCADATRPYEGITALLVRQRALGQIIAVLSNKADPAVQALCCRFFPGIPDAAAGERPGIPKKPAPDAIVQLLNHFSCTREETVYIGDSEVDLATARNAGIDCIGVTWGFRGREFLLDHGASLLASDCGELAALL